MRLRVNAFAREGRSILLVVCIISGPSPIGAVEIPNVVENPRIILKPKSETAATNNVKPFDAKKWRHTTACPPSGISLSWILAAQHSHFLNMRNQRLTKLLRCSVTLPRTCRASTDQQDGDENNS